MAAVGPFGWPQYKIAALAAIVIGFLLVLIADALNDSVRSELRDLRERDAEREKKLLAREGAFAIAIANQRKLVRTVLRAVAADLDFEDTERVNIYRIDQLRGTTSESRQVFTRLSRYSKNATFDTEGRTVYPFDEGVLRKAWDAGFWHDECPYPRGKTKYFRHMKKVFRIPETTARNMRMQPCSIAALRIDSPSGDMLGLICFESITTNRIDAERVRQVTMFYNTLLVAIMENDISLSTSSGAGL